MGRHTSASSAAAILAFAVLFLVALAAPSSASMVQVDQFGGNGTGAGQLDAPTQIAINEAAGEIYVAEAFNRRISVFDLNGRFLRMWGFDVDAAQPGTGFEVCTPSGSCKMGVFGSGMGQLANPSGIAVNPTTGDLYVADLGNARVQQFEPSGQLIRSWGWDVDATTPGTGFEICPATGTCKAGSFGGGDGQFGFFTNGRVVIDPTDGSVYVADLQYTRVQKFDSEGNFLAQFGSGQLPFNSPHFLALDSEGNVQVGGGDGSDAIVKFDSAGNFLSQIGVPPLAGADTGGLAVDPADDHLFVARTVSGEDIVQEFDSAGALVGTHGVGEGMTKVEAVAVRSTPRRLLVAANDTIVVLAEAAPEAITGGAAPRTDTEARLGGWVDPNGSPSSYYFEYGTDTSYGSSLPGGEAGSGAAPVSVSQQISGLQPGTTYHFRLVVEHAGGTVAGPDQAFTTRTAAEMAPPARGIELVSSPNKGNQNASTPEGLALSPDGEQAFWLVAGGAPGGTTGAYNLFRASRTANGWASTGVLPPAAEQYGEGDYHYKLLQVSKDRRRLLFFVDQGILAMTPYAIARVDLDGGSRTLQTFPTGNVDNTIKLVNANSDDLSRVVFPNPADGQLYDYGSETPQLVSVMPGGSAPACGVAESYGWHPGKNDWISADGTRAFFISAGDDCGSRPQLYVRHLDTGTTVPVSGTPDHGPLGDTLFVKANAEASRAVFLSETALVEDDENYSWDLYQYREGAQPLCLTCALGDARVRVESLTQSEQPVAVSDDLSHVYFVSRKRLRPGARSGADNLYVWSGGEVRFVAPTSLPMEGWSLTGDGRTLVFESSNGSLTADETGNTRQLYLYDYDNRSLECASCKRDGATTTEVGEPYITRTFRQLSEDGSTLAFVTMGRLVPEDINGAADVYEWRNGVLRLVTDGETKFPIGLADALPRGIDATGRTILFSAAARLTGFEQETTANLFAARIGGGFTPTAPPQPCVEDSCQGPLQPTPGLPAPGSAGVDGGGNLREKPAARRAGKKRAKQRKQRRAAKKRAAAKKKAQARKRAAANRGGGRNG